LITQYIFKAIAIGDGAVGKTSIVRRYVHDQFDPKYKKTIGVAHAVKRLDIEDTRVALTIWDTGGQELFNVVRPQYYRGSHGALVVYDVTSKESFSSLDKWFQDLYDQCGKIPIILIGNKIDLIEKRVILSEEGERYALKKGVTFYETSAKTGKNVVDVMEELANLIFLVAKSSESNENRLDKSTKNK
jgi:small GTP-binding protein